MREYKYLAWVFIKQIYFLFHGYRLNQFNFLFFIKLSLNYGTDFEPIEHVI